MTEKSFTPFFVADRQASLRILAGLKIPKGKKIGIMTHANTSSAFKMAFKKFPCFLPSACPVIKEKPCECNCDLSKCTSGLKMKESIIKMCDSGVFQKEGCGFTTYTDLFEKYEEAGADYGIIMDYLKKKDKTLETAKDAIDEYNLKKDRCFKLIGVAQGNNLNEYIECYKKLKDMGYAHIAIGGMLHRRDNSARYVQVKDETLLKETLAAIRKMDEDGWLFALGCYARKRHSIFTSNGVSGADYKGWIFQYEGNSPGRGNKKSQKYRFRQVREFIEEKVLSKPQEWKSDNRLLIVGCSKTKKMYKGRAMAINVYNGPLFKMIKKHVHDFSNEDGLDIMILSAKYGLVEPYKTIPHYDQTMTYEQALFLQEKNVNKIRELNDVKKYSKILINLSGNYFESLSPALEYLRNADDVEIEIVQGRIGIRIRDTKNWLLS